MSESFDLERFVAAQRPVYADVVEELRRGRKTSHWIWFIFPQIAGLGQSAMSARYGISSIEEAQAYLEHPILGPRLRECAGLVLSNPTSSVDEIFGALDARKVRSSMTLFHRAAPDERIFSHVLDGFFGGEADPVTQRLLG